MRIARAVRRALVVAGAASVLLLQRKRRARAYIERAIHHSIDPAQLQSNFSSGLATWDRIHQTARFDADPRDVTVGVVGHLDAPDVALARILRLPFSARALPPASHA